MKHLLAVSAISLASCVTAASGDERQQRFATDIQPLVKKYCSQCHGEQHAEGGVSFSKFAAAHDVLKARPMWLRALAKIRADEMPPKEKNVPRPAAAERELLVTWLDDWLNRIDCSGAPPPGHVTLRRLNRDEYRNTIRDLLGVDYRPTEQFPADDVGYGFDNIGDVLSLSPILLEKYLAAADEVARQTIEANEASEPIQKRLTGTEMKSDASFGATRDKGLHELFSNGEMSAKITLPRDGTYECVIMAAGDQAGDEPVKMALRINGRDATTIDVKAPRFAPGIYKTTFIAARGERNVAIAFLNDFYNPQGDPRKGRDRNLLVHWLEIRGPVGAAAPPAVNQALRNVPKLFVARPGEGVSEKVAAEKILHAFASRAYRRPATESDVARLVKIHDLARAHGESFDSAIGVALQAALVSPNFLFRVELAPAPTGGGVRTLNDFELASRLSYFLWSTMPDDELFRAAAANKLREPATLARQITRMLQDPKSQALIENFAGQWLQLRKLDSISIDRGRFPTFDEELRSAMRRESELFFTAIMRDDRPITELLTGRFTFVNQRLAEHYGMAGITGERFQRVSLEGTQRVGVLTQGSVLTVTSNPTRTSPVKRGKWVLDNLLNEPPPPPPPNVPELAADGKAELTGSLRQRMEQHRVNPACSGCHQQMDPLGFALENFDAVGRWRTRDGAHPVEAAGQLPSGEKFSSAVELIAVLERKKQSQFVRCAIEKMLTYALGRGLEYYDQCAVDKIAAALAKNDQRFFTLVFEIVQSEPFQKQGTRD